MAEKRAVIKSNAALYHTRLICVTLLDALVLEKPNGLLRHAPNVWPCKPTSKGELSIVRLVKKKAELR